MMQVSRRHWFFALLGAVLLHAGVAAAVLWQSPVVGAGSAGAGGIEVSLGPAGGAPGSTAAEVAEPEEVETVTPTELAEEPDLETQKAEPIEEATEPEAPEVQQAEAVEAQSAAKSEPVEAVEAEEPAPPLPEARPRDLPQQAVEHPAEPQQQAAQEPEPRAEQTARLPPSTQGAAGKAGTQDNAEAGNSSASTGGGTPGEVADYMARLQAWLERHKEYPRHARQRRQEGTVMLYFVMNREGRVLDYRVTESSGYDLLDRAVEEMIERAQPLPEMPAEMTQARLELRVPVQFFLR